MTTQHFDIAEHLLRIMSAEDSVDMLSAIPSLQQFLVSEERVGELEGERGLLFSLRIDFSSRCSDWISDNAAFREIGDFDTGNGHTKVEKIDATGAYLFTIRNIYEEVVCLLYTNDGFTDCRCLMLNESSFCSYGLNTVLMLTYAFASAHKQTLLIHASCVKQGDYAYAFIAKSGTGKSTQVSNWLKHVAGCELLNDDNPIIRIIDGQAFVYGSPWSGKTPCYRNIKAKLGAVTRIERADENKCVKQASIAAFTSLLPSCSTMKWEKPLYNNVIGTVTKVVETTGIYTLYCLPDRESAIVCNKKIRQTDANS